MADTMYAPHELDEVEKRTSFETVLRVNFDLHSTDIVPNGVEWLQRLRLAGIDCRFVEVEQPATKVRRGQRTEPRQ